MKSVIQRQRWFAAPVAPLMAFALIVAVAPPTAAANTFGGLKLKAGINDRRFYIDSTATGDIDVAAIAHAHTVWNNSDTMFDFQRQYVQQGAATVFHRNSGTSGTGAGAYCAITHWYDAGDLGVPPAHDWAWARAHIDPVNFTNARCGPQTDQHRGAIMAHEWGHGIGLAHVFTVGPIMDVDIWTSPATAPTADDMAGVNWLYPMD